MFPHSITIFNIINEKDKIIYNRKVVNAVFYYKKKLISQEGKGDKYTYAYHVIFSNEALKNYLEKDSYKLLNDKIDNYTLKENDIVVLGECDAIEDLLELQKSNKDYFLIRSIGDNRYGNESLQNMEITN